MPYEVIEHTADAGIAVTAATLPELLAEAARGMYSLIVDVDEVRPAERRDIEVTAATDEKRLLAWLLELLFLTETEGLVFSKFDVRVQGDAVHGSARGEPLDEVRHHPSGLIKGVTRHGLEVRQTESGAYRARIIFDM
jgi:SHS2 domain-containing protein